MQNSDVHELLNILSIILLSIETSNVPQAKVAIFKAEAILKNAVPIQPRKLC